MGSNIEVVSARQTKRGQDVARPIEDSATAMIRVIERAASNPDVDIDKMERLLQMQERILATNAEASFSAAMTAVQAEMPRIERDAENKQTHSKYAKLETVNKAMIPIYTKHGFSLSFGTTESPLPEHIRIVCYVSHTDGHTREYIYDSPLDMAGIQGNVNKTRSHGSGSAMSYGRRYLTLLIFNATMADEDDDGNTATPKEEPIRIAPVRLRKIVEGMLEAVDKEDGPGLLQIVDELDTGEQMFVWGQLRSWERSAIKKLLAAARVEAEKPDPNYIGGDDGD